MLVSLMQSFISYLSSFKKYSLHTIRNYSIDLECFRNFIENNNSIKSMLPAIKFNNSDNHKSMHSEGDIDINELNRDNIRKFMSKLYQSGKKRRTILRRIASIRSFCKFAISEGAISYNPSEGIDSPKINNNLYNALEPNEIHLFFEQPKLSSFLGFRDRCIMEVLFGTGIRVSELVSMNKLDIFFDECKIRIKGKGKQERMVPINSVALEWIKAYISHPERNKDSEFHKKEQDNNAVFLNCFGKRITTRSIDRVFKTYLIKSGLSNKITPHSLRRALACHYLEQGIDIKSIKNILGHKSIVSTTIYAKASSQLRMEEYKRAHPRA